MKSSVWVNVAQCIILLVSLVSLIPIGGGVPEELVSESSLALDVKWNMTYGGNSEEVCKAMIRTLDGGFALTGYTESYGAGYKDIWLVKTDSSGNMEWSETFGGSGGHESASALLQTGQGGFVLFGDRQEHVGGTTDYWLIGTDSTGNMQWNRSFSADGSAAGFSLVQTRDGGYLLVGRATTSRTWDEEHQHFIENDDFWIVKTDQFGNEQWNRTYDSGGVRDWPYSVLEASEANGQGYAILGLASSGTGATWDEDFWLVKADMQGNMEWNRKFSTINIDRGYCVIETSGAKGYLLAGPTHTDFWLIGIDEKGQIQWDKIHRSTGSVGSTHIQSCIDGGYISLWEDTLIKFDDSGNEIWRKRVLDYSYHSSVFVETAENEYVVAGSKEAYGNMDFLLSKLVVSESRTSLEPPTWLWIATVIGMTGVAIAVAITYFVKRKKNP